MIHLIDLQRAVGHFEKAVRNGDLVLGFEAALAQSALPLVDISRPIAVCIAQSDDSSIANHRRSAELLTSLFKRVAIPRLESIIDEDQKVSHQKFADDLDDILQNSAKFQSQLKLSSASSEFEPVYSPIIQSGGKYDLRVSATSNQDLLSFDCIIVQTGVRHLYMGANAARTFLVNPSPQQEGDYDALLELFIECQRQIKAGQALSAVYAAAERWLKERRPDLLPHFGKNCGHVVRKIVTFALCFTDLCSDLG